MIVLAFRFLFDKFWVFYCLFLGCMFISLWLLVHRISFSLLYLQFLGFQYLLYLLFLLHGGFLFLLFMNDNLENLLLLNALHMPNLLRVLFCSLLACPLSIFRFLLSFGWLVLLLKLTKVPSAHEKRVILGRLIWVFKVRLSLKLSFRLFGWVSLIVWYIDHRRIGRYALNGVNRRHIQKRVIRIGHLQSKHSLWLLIRLSSYFSILLMNHFRGYVCTKLNIHHLHLIPLFHLRVATPEGIVMLLKSRFVDFFQLD